MSALLQQLPAPWSADPRLLEAARELDRHYIPPRYPNAHPGEAPCEHYTRQTAEQAIAHTRDILAFYERLLAGSPEARIRLAKAASDLSKAHPEIEAIWLLGSLARGDATPSSDADIVIVVEARDLPFIERPPRYPMERCGIGVDLLVYTRAELEHMRAEGNLFLRRVEEERLVVLWQR